ncbi:hypothetical protein HDU83_004871 [Entophlyctis luteolus]|nr:hypothetical protein HDU83_004871 [Entophlyctis luteolus]
MHSDSLDALSAINSPRAPQPPPAESSAAAPKGRRNRNNASPTKDRDFENGFAFGSSRSATTTAHQGEADINDDAVDESDAPPGVATGSMSAGRGKTAVHKQQVVGSAKSGWGEDSVLNSEASKRRFNKRVENGQSKSTAEKLNRGASSRDNDFGDEKDQDDDDDNEGNDDNGNEIVPKRFVVVFYGYRKA